MGRRESSSPGHSTPAAKCRQPCKLQAVNLSGKIVNSSPSLTHLPFKAPGRAPGSFCRVLVSLGRPAPFARATARPSALDSGDSQKMHRWRVRLAGGLSPIAAIARLPVAHYAIKMSLWRAIGHTKSFIAIIFGVDYGGFAYPPAHRPAGKDSNPATRFYAELDGCFYFSRCSANCTSIAANFNRLFSDRVAIMAASAESGSVCKTDSSSLP
jgi:hypothetical protein